MSIETDLTALDSDLVAANREQAASRLQALDPTLDMKRGVIHDILLHYGAILEARNQTHLDAWRRSSSLAAIEEDPALADEEIVDNLLSNFFLSRQQATPATGEVTIVVSDNTTVSIARGATFTANGKSFTADEVYTAKAEEDLVVSDTDRLLVPRSDGNYAFTISVTAVDAGTASQIRRNTLVIPDSPPINFVTAFAAEDFQGGLDLQTNQELLTRLREGRAAKTTGANRITMNAWLRDPDAGEAFSSIVRTSIIGYGQAEQRRYHTVFPVGFGGRVDWYLRTSGRAIRQWLTKTCTLVEKTADGFGIWQGSLERDEFPGFYDVTRIVRVGEEDSAGGFEITEEGRGYDLTGFAVPPDIESAEEAAYTRFQTATLRFEDTLTSTADLEVGDTASYSWEVRGLPNLDVIQDKLDEPDHRPRLCDLLVRAPVPCFVSLMFDLFKQPDVEEPDLDAIRAALANRVHAVGFHGRLDASALVDTIHDHLDESMTIGPVDMLGEIRRPDGTLLRLRSDATLQVPDEPERMVSARTVQFFLDLDDVVITVRSIVPAED